MEFNEQQRRIIEQINGAFLISAPVGTGKTTVLTQRIITALKQGILPEQILCLTFTNRAADEMLSRIQIATGSKKVSDEITIKTFHGFCAYLIKSESHRLGISNNFSIYDEVEQIEILKNILAQYPHVYSGDRSSSYQLKQLIYQLYQYRLRKLENEIGCNLPEINLTLAEQEINELYLETLRQQNALDFNELVVMTLRALYQDEKIKDKWSKRYSFIQVDEFQDTHLSEYLVVKELGKESKNLTFVGDLDQTIYSFRGSQPASIAKLFKKHFDPVTEFNLTINYRFNPQLLKAVNSFLKSFEAPATKEITSMSNDTNTQKPIDFFSGYSFTEEAAWIVDSIKQIKQGDPKATFAVLMRSNTNIEKIAEVFKQNKVPHVTADSFQFFKRQEVKDLLAYVRLIFNRFDLQSAQRVVSRPPRGIGEKTLMDIVKGGEDCALRLSDFLNFTNYKRTEPFSDLITSFAKGRIVVLDTETTGTNPLKDEIIQIYVVEVINGKRGESFHHYLKNTIAVGNSELVHGISDEFLQTEGKDPRQILSQLKDFIGGSIVVGHNVNFDLQMIIQNGNRHKLSFAIAEFYDTLDLARRLIKSDNYKLTTLCKLLKLSSATHDAEDDVIATVDLLEVLINRLKEGAEKRQLLFKKYSAKFIGLASSLRQWTELVKSKRPSEVLFELWDATGLKEYYQQEAEFEKRQKTIDTLLELLKNRKAENKEAETAMREIINFISLTKDINFLGLEKGSIPIVSIHQVKGLEFDHVFIAGLNEFKFPVYKSDPEEEKRIFYVALTRAKKKIYLSSSQFDDNGKPLNRSIFIDYLDPDYLTFIS